MNALTFTLLIAIGPVADADPRKSTVRKYGDTWEFYVGEELVSKYHIGERVPKPYLWPLNAPGGVGVTRDWPMKRGTAGESTDHVHQKSAWFTYGDVVPEGVTLTSRPKGVKGVDFWTEGPQSGKIVCLSVSASNNKADRVVLNTRNSWKTPEGRGIMDETRDIELLPLDDARLFILKIRLSSSTQPLVFADTKEGAMAVRVHDQLAVKSGSSKSHITNSLGGDGETACWGYKADWCDYSGEINGQAVGITIFDDPTNRSRACWHVRSYGLMAANPFGRSESGFPAQKGSPEQLIKLKSGEELKLRYGILVHKGDVKTGRVVEHFRKFLALTD